MSFMVSPLDCGVDRPRSFGKRKLKSRPEKEQQDRTPLRRSEDYQTGAGGGFYEPGIKVLDGSLSGFATLRSQFPSGS
jgi:hypothetical protein